MFKRFLERLFSFGHAKGEDKNLPLRPGSQNHLDPDGVFAITLPISFHVETSPLETFSERAIKAYRTAAIQHCRVVKGSIMQPQLNGTLRIYPPTEAEKDKKRRN